MQSLFAYKVFLYFDLEVGIEYTGLVCLITSFYICYKFFEYYSLRFYVIEVIDEITNFNSIWSKLRRISKWISIVFISIIVFLIIFYKLVSPGLNSFKKNLKQISIEKNR